MADEPTIDPGPQKGGDDAEKTMGKAEWAERLRAGAAPPAGRTAPTEMEAASVARALPASPAPRKKAPALPGVGPDGDIGRYRILEELGRGGMGVVYRAHEKALNRDVALKVLLVGGRVDEQVLDRFQREARAAAALEHPNIVKVYDVGMLPGEEAALPYYTMELLSGEDLAGAIHGGHLTPRVAVEAVRQVALALGYAHHKGILHRDIKPQNIFLRRQETVAEANAPTVLHAPAGEGEVHALLLDFGLAKLTEHDLSSEGQGSRKGKSVQSLTQSGQILGTPHYMAPEQAMGAKEIDARADVYGLGAALYHALAGEPPFKAATLAELLYKVQRVDADPPSRLNGEVDLDLDTLCLKSLAKEPKDRYQTAGDLAEDCRRWLAGDPISSRPVGLVGRLWRRARRNKAFAIPVAALSLVIVLGLVGWAGLTIQDGVRFRAYVSEAEKALAAGDLKEALARGQLALGMRPDDHGAKLVLARVRCAEGEIQRREYDRQKIEVARLEAVEEAELPEDAAPEERDRDREGRWGREGALAEARRGRGEAWSNAVRRYLEALGHLPDHLDARRALADLYWDELLRAEGERDAAEALRYAGLVEQFGGEEYAAKVRGEKEVRVRFTLPHSFAGNEVKAYLFEYVANARPPVLVPVPYDPVRKEVLGDGQGQLAGPQIGRWKPLPLKEATGAGPGGTASPEEVAQLRQRADHLLSQRDYAHAVEALDRLTRLDQKSAMDPYNLACALARTGGRAQEALAALSEAVRRGWGDAEHTMKDEDLASLRGDPGFEVLLAVLRGDLPRRHVRIDGIVADSQAAKLDLRGGDLLVTIDWQGQLAGGKRIETIDDAKAAIQGAPKAQAYDVVVRRGAEIVKATASGGGPLGVQLSQVDLTPQGPTAFAGVSAPAAPKAVREVREAPAYPLRLLEGNRIGLPVVDGAAVFKERLPKGAYLLYVPQGQGLYETRYPFEVGREFEWDEACELVAEEAPPLPPGLDPSLAKAYWIHVSAGPYRASGDPKAQQSPPRRAARIRVPEKGDGGFFLGRFEVTCAMYLVYLDDRAWQGEEAAAARLPRQAPEAGFYWEKDGSGGFRMALCGADWPVFAISWDDAVDYCKWLTKTSGHGEWSFCLPEEDEWEKAARGPDGRPFPWGDSFDSTFCRMQTSRPGEQENLDSEPDGLFPLDESPFGLRDMAGGMGEWSATVTGTKKQWRILKGGAWGSPSAGCRAGSRLGNVPRGVGGRYGLRVCARRAPP